MLPKHLTNLVPVTVITLAHSIQIQIEANYFSKRGMVWDSDKMMGGGDSGSIGVPFEYDNPMRKSRRQGGKGGVETREIR
jgi:hypothetical protein